jgi:hypothetical protein
LKIVPTQAIRNTSQEYSSADISKATATHGPLPELLDPRRFAELAGSQSKKADHKPSVCHSGAASVVTRRNFAAPAEKVWKKLMFYEQIDQRPPLVLRLLLPTPIRTEGGRSRIGDEVKCQYAEGHLIKRVTQIDRERHYIFDIIEQNLALGGGIRLSGGSYALREVPGGGTDVLLETRYVSSKRPRWICERIEAIVCHLFHRHILGAIGGDLPSRETST